MYKQKKVNMHVHLTYHILSKRIFHYQCKHRCESDIHTHLFDRIENEYTYTEHKPKHQSQSKHRQEKKSKHERGREKKTNGENIYKHIRFGLECIDNETHIHVLSIVRLTFVDAIRCCHLLILLFLLLYSADTVCTVFWSVCRTVFSLSATLQLTRLSRIFNKHFVWLCALWVCFNSLKNFGHIVLWTWMVQIIEWTFVISSSIEFIYLLYSAHFHYTSFDKSISL